MTTNSASHQPDDHTWREIALANAESSAWYRQMRETQPVAFDPQRGAWLVFRYADVEHILLKPEIFSSRQEHALPGEFVHMDPPQHRTYRSLVTQAFTPRHIARLEPRITQLVNERLDRVAQQKRMDVIDDLAFPLPATVIAELLGVPPAEQGQFRQWATEIIGTSQERMVAAQKAMGAYFSTVIAQKRNAPQDDLISSLLAAEVDGERLSERALVGICVLLLIAGHETTTNLLGNALLALDEYLEAMEELCADLSALPTAIEEVLRSSSPVVTTLRRATRDTMVGGQEIKAGQLVMPLLASANRDEERFPTAESFDIHRTPNPHLVFGHGIHFCLGAPLARLEARIALGAMLERLPNLKRDRSVPLVYKPSSVISGVQHLLVTFGEQR